MRSDAETASDYLAALPAERREAVEALRRIVLDNLPDGYGEAMNWGMITYEVPLETSGRTYNGKPLMYAAIASQKKHMALYLCGLNCAPGMEEEFREAFAAGGRKLDMGKACVRFRKLEDLDLDAVARVVAAVPPEEFVAIARAAHDRSRR